VLPRRLGILALGRLGESATYVCDWVDRVRLEWLYRDGSEYMYQFALWPRRRKES